MNGFFRKNAIANQNRLKQFKNKVENPISDTTKAAASLQTKLSSIDLQL